MGDGNGIRGFGVGEGDYPTERFADPKGPPFVVKTEEELKIAMQTIWACADPVSRWDMMSAMYVFLKTHLSSISATTLDAVIDFLYDGLAKGRKERFQLQSLMAITRSNITAIPGGRHGICK